jgi:hypothetical protein
MIEFEWFVYGFATGWFAVPICHIGKRIVEEARIAQRNWNKRD